MNYIILNLDFKNFHSRKNKKMKILSIVKKSLTSIFKFKNIKKFTTIPTFHIGRLNHVAIAVHNLTEVIFFFLI